MPTTVQNTVTDPSGNALVGLAVRITLVTATTGSSTPGHTATTSITAPETVYTDNTGKWSAALVPNSQITSPTGTYYTVTEGGYTSTIQVPAVGGPYNLADVLVGTPPVPATAYVVAPATVTGAANGTAAGTRAELNFVAGANVTVTAADNPGAGRVDVTITAASGSGIPSSTVVSETGFGQAAAAGTATAYSRGDHTHGTPTAPTPASVGAPALATLTAKGDLYVATAAGTVARLPVGSDGQTLTASSAQAAGMNWATPTGPGIYPLAGYGLLAASADPVTVQNPSTINNTRWYTRIWIPAYTPITNLWAAVRTGGTWDGVTAGNQLGLYDDTGAKIGNTADDGTLWAAAGWRGGAVVGGPVAAQATGRFVYIVWTVRGWATLNPVLPFPMGAADANAAFASTGVGGGNRRAAYDTGTGLPASFVPATVGTSTGFLSLVGVS